MIVRPTAGVWGEAVESAGRKVIRFRQGGREYARVYACCWGHYYNCNRTRIGKYCQALDEVAQAWLEPKVAEARVELANYLRESAVRVLFSRPILPA